MRVLIIGYGYVGSALGQELVRKGHTVLGVKRGVASESGSPPGVPVALADVTLPESLSYLPGDWEWVVNTVSATGGTAEDYRRIYVQGTRNLVDWLEHSSPRLKKFVCTSSTGVYGQNDGTEVTEESATEPPTESGKVLLETERILLDAVRGQRFPAVILRVAGIYGPGRGYWLRQFLSGQARLEGTGQRVLNMIHRDDVVRIIQAALERGQVGRIYNAVDDEPVSQRTLFQWLAEALNRPLPPVSPEQLHRETKRGATNKIVLNGRLKRELGYTLKFPTFREGYRAELPPGCAEPRPATVG